VGSREDEQDGADDEGCRGQGEWGRRQPLQEQAVLCSLTRTTALRAEDNTDRLGLQMRRLAIVQIAPRRHQDAKLGLPCRVSLDHTGDPGASGAGGPVDVALRT